MKRILFIISVFFLSANAFAKDIEFDIYKGKMQKCDEIYTQQAEKSVTTADQREVAYNAVNCYKVIGEEVIDKYYSKHSKEMKKKFIDFVKSSYAITAYIHQMHDSCTPTCGSMGTVLYIGITESYVKKLVEDIILGAEDYKI